jgi:hypothetical protein
MRNGAGSKRRGKSSFPKQRDPVYRRWVWTENPCMLRGRRIKTRLSVHDMLEQWQYDPLEWFHCCWGPIDPAHVGEKQSQGAPDFGVLVPLCRAAHTFYDEHRDQWARVTGYSERKMALAASGYAQKYVEGGGVPLRAGTDPT